MLHTWMAHAPLKLLSASKQAWQKCSCHFTEKERLLRHIGRHTSLYKHTYSAIRLCEIAQSMEKQALRSYKRGWFPPAFTFTGFHWLSDTSCEAVFRTTRQSRFHTLLQPVSHASATCRSFTALRWLSAGCCEMTLLLCKYDAYLTAPALLHTAARIGHVIF